MTSEIGAETQGPRTPFPHRITSQNTYHPILPFCYFDIRVSRNTVNSFILRTKGMKAVPVTLGDHLRNRRLTLCLTQDKVAATVGTLREVYDRWERDERQPVVSMWPPIILFLGSYPWGSPTPASQVLKTRRCLGVDQKTFAKLVGVAHQQVRRWERGLEEINETAQQVLRRLPNPCLNI